MGEELAATLMEMLPGVGWADVARRRDVEREIEHLRDWASVRFDAIDRSMVTHAELRKNTYTIIGAHAIVVTVVAALAQIF